jgi:hypothetical protein
MAVFEPQRKQSECVLKGVTAGQSDGLEESMNGRDGVTNHRIDSLKELINNINNINNKNDLMMMMIMMTIM